MMLNISATDKWQILRLNGKEMNQWLELALVGLQSILTASYCCRTKIEIQIQTKIEIRTQTQIQIQITQAVIAAEEAFAYWQTGREG